MDHRNLILLILIAITLVLATAIIVHPADAVRIEQGDQTNPNAIVYFGETADISLALSWPDFKIAWCKSGYPGCNPPDQVIEILGFQHSYFIDPEIFHPGQYYRWSGEWNRGENANAFYVMTGTRPAPTPETPTPTPTPTPEPGVDEEGNGPFHYLITRGDSPAIKLHFNKDSDVCVAGEATYDGYWWMFGSQMQLDVPLRQTGNDYWYEMSVFKTSGLTAGDYTGYLQFTGKNGLQDVFLSPDGTFLDSPYDDKVVPNVPLNLYDPYSVKQAFQTVVTSAKYSDDILIPFTMEVREPELIIENVEQGNDKLWVTGRTTWCDGTVLTVKLDPDNYKLASDIRQHTWTTVVSGDITDYRHFEITVPYDTDELYIGTHELKFTVEKNGYLSDVFHNFAVTGTYITPEPTKEFRKVTTDMNGNPIPKITTVVPTTATPVPTFNEQTNTSVVNLTPVATGYSGGHGEGAPVPTTATTAVPKPVATTPNVVVPLSPLPGILALAVAWMVVRR